MGLKKMLSAALVAGTVMAGCAQQEHRWVIRIDGHDITPQEYISAQMNAYIEAQNYSPVSIDTLSFEIEGMPADRWINRQAVNILKEYHLMENEFESRRLTISDEAMSYLDAFCRQGWENVSALYTNNGLNTQQYRDYLTGLYRQQLVFNDIYMSGEDNTALDRQVKEYIGENICRVSYFIIPKINDNGTRADESQLRQLQLIAAGAQSEIDAGAEMLQVAGEYLPQTAALLGSAVDFSDGASYVYTDYISAETADSFAQRILTSADGSSHVYESDSCYYICQKLPAYDTESDYLILKQSVVNLLKDSEFTQYIADRCETMEVEYNARAVEYYSPSKIVIDFN